MLWSVCLYHGHCMSAMLQCEVWDNCKATWATFYSSLSNGIEDLGIRLALWWCFSFVSPSTVAARKEALC